MRSVRKRGDEKGSSSGERRVIPASNCWQAPYVPWEASRGDRQRRQQVKPSNTALSSPQANEKRCSATRHCPWSPALQLWQSIHSHTDATNNQSSMQLVGFRNISYNYCLLTRLLWIYITWYWVNLTYSELLQQICAGNDSAPVWTSLAHILGAGAAHLHTVGLVTVTQVPGCDCSNELEWAHCSCLPPELRPLSSQSIIQKEHKKLHQGNVNMCLPWRLKRKETPETSCVFQILTWCCDDTDVIWDTTSSIHPSSSSSVKHDYHWHCL